MAGYVRQSAGDIISGNIIKDEFFNREYDALAGAFNGTSGHAHDGSVGNGPKLNINNATTGILAANRVDIPPVDLTGYVKGDESQVFENGKISIWQDGMLRASSITYTDLITDIYGELNNRSVTRTIGSGKTTNGLVFSTSADGRTFDVSTWTADSLRNRANHTGTQQMSTIAGLDVTVQGLIDEIVDLDTSKENKSALKALAYKDQITTSELVPEGSSAYVVGRSITSGPPREIPLSTSPAINSIPFRSSGGRIQSNSPVDANDVVNKSFLDSSLASKITKAGDTAIGGFSSYAEDDGNTVAGMTYRPTITGGNYRALYNNSNFTFGSPSDVGAYSIVVDIQNTANAGAVVFQNFAPGYPKGDTLTVTEGHRFRISICKSLQGTTARIEALQ